jgi:hypothetical protein
MQWTVKGLLPKKGLVVIYGESGSGKSFLTMDLACTIAAEIPKWFGAKVKSVPIAYVALEGESGIGQRMKAWQMHNHRQASSNIRFKLGNFTLLESSHVLTLAADITKALGPSAVVIVDTLNQSAPGADENSSVDMGRIISNAKILADAVDGLVILVHHAGKDKSKGIRGHSSLHAATDAVIEVLNTAAGRAWRVTKVKDGELGVAHGFELEPYVVGKDEDGDDQVSCAVKRTLLRSGKAKPPGGRNQKAALAAIAALKPALAEGVPYEDAKRCVADLLNCEASRRNAKAKETIDSLIESRHIEMEGGLIYLHEQ